MSNLINYKGIEIPQPTPGQFIRRGVGEQLQASGRFAQRLVIQLYDVINEVKE